MIHIRVARGLAVIGCGLLASCYPYDENPQPKPGAGTRKPSAHATDTRVANTHPKPAPARTITAGPTDASPSPAANPKPPGAPTPDYPFALKVPGKPNYVLNPYTKKLVWCLDDNGKPWPRGSILNDESIPLTEKKFFRMP